MKVRCCCSSAVWLSCSTMNDSHVRRFASSLARSSPRGATEMAHMLMAGNIVSQALAITGNARLLSCASTSLMMVLSPPTYPIRSRSLPPKISLSLACRNMTRPMAIDAANNASGIVVIFLIFPVIVSSKMFLVVHSGSRLAAKATYLAEMASSSRCFRTYSWFLRTSSLSRTPLTAVHTLAFGVQ